MELKLGPDIEQAPALKLQLNIGACLDVPTGTWQIGRHGEYILNGGLGFIVGMVGIGNNFKSTLLHGMTLKGMARVFQSCHLPEKKTQRKLKRMKTSNSTYDTEVNIQEPRLKTLVSAVRELAALGVDFFDPDTPYWQVTDKTVAWGNEFFEKFKDFTAFKRKNKAAYYVQTPFLDRDGKTLINVILPTFGAIDSLTDFQSENEEKIMKENELGDSGGNMLFARGGLIKTRLLTELPALCGGGYHYLGMTAQLNAVMAMGGGPGGAAIPRKSLQHLNSDSKIVGATNKFSYATTVGFNAFDAKPFLDGNRMPEYPHPTAPAISMGDTDLNMVKLKVLRNKNGPTGMTIKLLVTQREGLQFELTQFDYIREFVTAEKGARPGIIGKGAYYTLALYPECALLRGNLREKIENDSKLRMAIHYTCEILETSIYHPSLWAEYGCDIEELYTNLKEQGYDWDLLLSARPHFVFNNDINPVPFLSSVDLLRMRKKEYFPFWMTEDKKGIKPEYQFEYE